MSVLKVKLEKETSDTLKELCNGHKTTPDVLVMAFLKDLTGTPGSGSDERMYAYNWFMRHLDGDDGFYY